MIDWTSILQISGTIGGIFATAGACWLGYRKVKGIDEKRIQRLHESVVDLLQAESKAWRDKFDLEHTEYLQYRDSTHAKANETQDTILKLNKENSELHARTDITQVMQSQQKILDTLTSISNILRLIQQELTKPKI